MKNSVSGRSTGRQNKRKTCRSLEGAIASKLTGGIIASTMSRFYVCFSPNLTAADVCSIVLTWISAYSSEIRMVQTTT